MKHRQHEYPRIPFSGIKLRRGLSGFGIFATEPIKKGTFIIEYWGPLLNDEETTKKGGKYLFEVAKNKTIDGSSRKNTARYINHACKPNCEVTITRGRVFIHAIKNIKEGEELTYDYGKEYVDEYIKPYGCRCKTCKK
jgi:SET domain-containing protein